MGLFNRGSKSGVPLTGDEWSTNGASHQRERNGVPKPGADEQQAAPAAPSEPVSSPPEPTDLETADVSTDPQAASEESAPTSVEPEPTPAEAETQAESAEPEGES